MAYLLKDIVLDALSLPENWQEKLPEIAAEKLKISRKNITGAELLSASIDSRRGTPKLLLTMKVAGGVPETPPEEFAAFIPKAPEIPEIHTA